MEWDTSKQIGKKVPIKEKSKISYVNMEDITHITCSKYVSNVYMIDGKNHSVARLLKYFEEDLVQYAFLRVHDCALVNIRYARVLLRTQRILYIGNIPIHVSKRKIALCEKIMEHVNSKNSTFAEDNSNK